jgi:hypothetical protein
LTTVATPTGIEPHPGTLKSRERTNVSGEASERWYANGRESEQLATLSRSFVHATTAGELRAAIAAVTRALAVARDRDDVLELARERTALRQELQGLQDNVSNEVVEPSGTNILPLDVDARTA